MEINASTRYCAVIGHPIQHSASPTMHNAGIAALGLNWRYLAFDVPPDNLRAAIEGARTMKFIGLNLTVPHKLLALEMVDELDVSAQQWGAVNTIRFEARDAQGQWRSLAQFAGHVPDEIQAKASTRTPTRWPARCAKSSIGNLCPALGFYFLAPAAPDAWPP